MTTTPPPSDVDFARAVLLDKDPGSPRLLIPDTLQPRDETDQLRLQQTATLVYQAIIQIGKGLFVDAASSIVVAMESSFRELEANVIVALNRADTIADILDQVAGSIPELRTAIDAATEKAILQNTTPERYAAAKEKLGELLAGAGSCDGNHAAPPCDDYRCWNRDPADGEDAHALRLYLENLVDTIDRHTAKTAVVAGREVEVVPMPEKYKDLVDCPPGCMEREHLLTGHPTGPQVPDIPDIPDSVTERFRDPGPTLTESVAEKLKAQRDAADNLGEAPPISAQDLNREEPTDGPQTSS